MEVKLFALNWVLVEDTLFLFNSSLSDSIPAFIPLLLVRLLSSYCWKKVEIFIYKEKCVGYFCYPYIHAHLAIRKLWERKTETPFCGNPKTTAHGSVTINKTLK